jgi:hypothetical protein
MPQALGLGQHELDTPIYGPRITFEKPIRERVQLPL